MSDTPSASVNSEVAEPLKPSTPSSPISPIDPANFLTPPVDKALSPNSPTPHKVSDAPEHHLPYDSASPAHKVSESQWAKLLDKIRENKQLALDPKAQLINRAYHETRMLKFASTFLKQHTSDEASGERTPFSSFHEELTELLVATKPVDAQAKEGLQLSLPPLFPRLAIAAPRGHAKSTLVSFFFIIHQALYAKKKNIVIVSSSEDMAIRFLRRIKTELEFNKQILITYGPQKSEKWSETEIVLTNGVTIHAKGRGAQLRGLISGSRRPDLIILDDIEDEELVRSEVRRADLSSWFSGTVLPTLSPKVGQLVFIGTILHQDSLLNSVIETYKDFTAKKYAALLPNDEPLWPERFTKDFLHQVRKAFAERHQLPQFFMEYMNDPTPPDTAFFDMNQWHYFDKQTILDNRKNLVVEVVIDPGGGSVRNTADDTAIVVGATDAVTGKAHILEIISAKMGTDTNWLIEHLFRINEAYSPHIFIMEKTQATNFIMPTLTYAMQQRNQHLPIRLVTPPRGRGQGTGNMSDAKFQRISALVQPVKDQTILILPEHTKLVSQAASFPRGKHDDVLDALAYFWMFGFKPVKIDDKYQEELDNPAYETLYEEIGL